VKLMLGAVHGRAQVAQVSPCHSGGVAVALQLSLASTSDRAALFEGGGEPAAQAGGRLPVTLTLMAGDLRTTCDVEAKPGRPLEAQDGGGVPSVPMGRAQALGLLHPCHEVPD
jgi:hypothetical protein